ncbi:ABC transporter ATP-binding protein [Candidatus Nomurabacteria bacterium]|nr:ABC transporter ATP-binding protein [Candidatus Nomurabacteria bacterium]
MKPIIEVKNIGKKYDITHQRGGYLTLRDVLTSIFKNPFSFLKTKTKQIIGLETKEEFWALKDINFSVQKGEVIGIIGHNGAGKSTLLKILSQITPPTTGEIKIHGRVGSLLEVGTGFHPELTGRENIFLNGAILGMKKKEIAKKFDEIVEFADIGKFLDTPVKYYSSGMYVRLAFSVAAHMETDILIVDEVLAVGDAEFQKKCLGKMEEITKQQGRTVLFVSHNLNSIKELCKKTILIENGQIKAFNITDKILDIYNENNNKIIENKSQIEFENNNKNKDFIFKKIWINKEYGATTNMILHNQDFDINVEMEIFKESWPLEISLTIKNSNGVNVTSTSLSDSEGGKVYVFKRGLYKTVTKIKGDFLIPDTYTIRLYAHEKGVQDIDIRDDAIRFKIIDAGSTMHSYGEASTYWSCVFSNANWEIQELK